MIPRIYPITDRQLSGLSHTDQAERLIAGGAALIQLREKSLPSREFFDDARCALEIAHKAGAKILINDRVDLAMALGADGVHLGQDDLPPEEGRKLLGPDAIIGFSTHSVDQALAALELPIDYLAIGPIFATSTKEDPDPVVGLAGLRAVRAIAGTMPIVAIGGINESNLASIFASGADSAALIRAVVGIPSEIEKRMRILNNY